MEFLFIYMFVLSGIAGQQQDRRRRRLKPRVRLDVEAFLGVMDRCNSKIIKTGKMWLQGYMYCIEDDDYFYITMAKSPIRIPGDREVVECLTLQF
jgi:hypothetical protein